MHGNNATDEGVVLRYSLTREDLLDAFSEQHRRARRPWFLRRFFLAVLIVTGVLGLGILGGAAVDGTLSFAVAFVPVLLIVVAIVFATPRLLYRTAVRQLVRNNPGLTHPSTATISPAGISTSTAFGEMTATWTQYPYHAETERVFCVFATDRLGGMLMVFPKRGLSTKDPAPLRSLFTSHSQQLGP